MMLGLGETYQPSTMTLAKPCEGGPAEGCFPTWCQYWFGDWFDACKVPTAAQQAAVVKTDIEKAAGAGTPQYNPDLAAEQYAEYLKDTEAYCQVHPDECAQYTAAGEHPTCSALFGAGPTAAAFCKNPGGYLILGGAALFGIILLATRRN